MLKEPQGCPPKIYAMMKYCWNMESAARPPFSELHKMLRNYRESESSIEDDHVSRYSIDSDMSSDAFLEENSIDGLSLPEADM